jgi:hypothetical protein
MKPVQGPVLAPFEHGVAMRIDLVTKFGIGDIGMVGQHQSHFGALDLHIGRLVACRQSAGLFKLFSCKGRLIFWWGTGRKRAPLAKDAGDSSRLLSFRQRRNPTRI